MKKLYKLSIAILCIGLLSSLCVFASDVKEIDTLSIYLSDESWEYKGFDISEYNGSDLLYLHFVYTNNSDTPKHANYDLMITPYQNGVQLNHTLVLNYGGHSNELQEEINNSSKKIMKGASVAVCYTYQLIDSASEIEFYLKVYQEQSNTYHYTLQISDPEKNQPVKNISAESQVIELKNQISSMQTEVDKVTAKEEEYKNKISSLQADLEEASKNYEEEKGKNTILLNDLEKAEAELSSAATDRDKYKERWKSVKKKYEKATAKIEKLEAEIAASKEQALDEETKESTSQPDPDPVESVLIEEVYGEPDPDPTQSPQDMSKVEGTFETYLGAGVYTAGLDIPTGRYNLSAYSGSGNVHSYKGINEIMGFPASNYQIETFNGLSLAEGAKLEVGGTLVLFMHSDNAKIYDMSTRQITNEYEVYLTPGNYIAGVDFPVGVYNVVATDGSGNVHCRDAELNEILSTVADDMRITQFNNAEFKDGSTLEVSSCSIRLVPVGK